MVEELVHNQWDLFSWVRNMLAAFDPTKQTVLFMLTSQTDPSIGV